MKHSIAVLLFIASGVAVAKGPEPVSVGKGVYMMTDRNWTIFGSSDGIITKLMTKANSFCKAKSGSEAELVDSAGSEAVPGVINNSGVLRRPAQGATGTIYFRCGSTTTASTQPQTFKLPDSYYERVSLLQEKVLEGEISAGKGFASQQVSIGFSPLQETDVAMLEGRSTWWVDKSKRWFIHLQNVTLSNLEAFEFALNSGSCAKPTSEVRKVIIQLERPIRAGDQAVINFSNPIATETSDQVQCGVVSAAWGTPG
jgi:hypothetical protein